MQNIRFILQLTICSVLFHLSLILSQQQIPQLNFQSQGTSRPSSPPKQKTMTFNSNLIVSGNIKSARVISKKITVKNKGVVEGTLKTKEVITDKLSSETTYVNSLMSPNGIIVIDGDVIISNESNDEAPLNVALKGESFSINEVKQFGLIHHDDFDSEQSLNGWSNKKTNRCSPNGNSFLGGHCNFSYEEVKKSYKLPEHETLRITAGFHMFDNWNGEHGYMKIDGEVAWSREGQIDKEGGLNFCGGDSNDPAFNLIIDITIPHKTPELQLAFGSTLEADPCQASFGIDDVMIYIK